MKIKDASPRPPKRKVPFGESIVRGASAHPNVAAALCHLAYTACWKRFEPLKRPAVTEPHLIATASRDRIFSFRRRTTLSAKR